MNARELKYRLLETARWWGGVVVAAAKNWMSSHAFVYAGALAFFTLFSLAPVVIIAVTIVGWVLGTDVARERIAAQLEEGFGPEATEAVFNAVEAAELDQTGFLPTLLALGAMVVGATTVFAQMQQGLNVIWDVAARPSRSGILIFIKNRMLSLAIVLSIGFVLLVSLLLSVALRATMGFAEQWLPVHAIVMIGLELALSVVVITALFAAMFRILPDVILRWRDVMAGAFATTLLFVTGRSLIATYLAYTAPGSTYGAAGSLVLVLLWVYYSSLILLFGAAFTRAHLEARGKTRRPRSTAVCVATRVEEDSTMAGPGSG